jgi:hypothetical protein
LVGDLFEWLGPTGRKHKMSAAPRKVSSDAGTDAPGGARDDDHAALEIGGVRGGMHAESVVSVP